MTARRHDFMGCPVDGYSFDGVVGEVVRRIEARGRPSLIHFLNVAKVVKAASSPRLRQVLWDGDLVLADGQPLLPFGRRLGIRLPERVAGIDLMNRLLEVCGKKGFSVYLLGARQAVLETCVGNIRKSHPDLRIAGYRNGYWKEGELDSVLRGINRARPDVLFVGMGTPQKELFAFENREKLEVPVIQGSGGTFDVIAGLARRAPLWMQRWGLEWLYRVIQEPRRLFWRYFSTNALFLLLFARAFIQAAHRT